MAKTRRAYTGGAASTTTSSNILSSGTTSFTITAYTGWPYGSDPFFVVVEPGTANEEKILVTRTGSTDTTINVYATPSVAANRGADGTSSVAHSSGVTVFPVFTALDADEANELTSAFGSKGDLVSYGSSTFETLGVGTNDEVLIADSGEASGLKWGSVDTAQLADDAVTGAKLANATVETKTASYTLVAGDRNKRIVMNNAGATTITVDDAVFAAGDVVWIHNIGAGTCTVTAGTATVNTAASLDLAQWEGGSLYFTSASSAIFFRGPAAGVGTANFTDTETGTYSSGGKNYKYLTFTSSGTITFDTAGLADILVIGGGGGSGHGASAGAGAGGYLDVTGAYFPVGTLTVVVGAGGAGGPAIGGVGLSGQNGTASRLDNYYAVGGGTGAQVGVGSAGLYDGWIGGSGGGACDNGTGGSGTSGQGNDGGDGPSLTSGTRGAGGGGGAGTAGSDAVLTIGGNGGNGLSSSITGSAVTRAGGGGGMSLGGTAGTGGTGGGGDGSATASGTAGTANTGGGAGGSDTGSVGVAGGSGIVVVRVEV